jgi:hypothetical protein
VGPSELVRAADAGLIEIVTIGQNMADARWRSLSLGLAPCLKSQVPPQRESESPVERLPSQAIAGTLPVGSEALSRRLPNA